MTTHAIFEARVVEIVGRVRAGGDVEDDLVELKRGRPDAAEMARRLAAHANRANGSDIMWILGLDQRTGSVHDVDSDIAGFWEKVQSRFDDEVAPALKHNLVVPVSPGESVLALGMATDRAPYVVKTGEERISREIPIRDGTRVRTARRRDVLALFGQPRPQLPTVHILSLDVDVMFNGPFSVSDPHAAPWDIRAICHVLIDPGGTKTFLRADGMKARGAVVSNGVETWSHTTHRKNAKLAAPPEDSLNRVDVIADGAYV